MFRNVLVGIDGSASATEALTRAVEIARESRGRLGLLGVAASPNLGSRIALPPFTLPISTPQLAAQLRAGAQCRVDRAERTVPRDLPVTKLLSGRSMTDALLDLTRDGHWDLIVIGHGSFGDRLRRGVGLRLLRASPVPVLIVPSACEPPPRRSPTASRCRRRHGLPA